MKKSEEILKLLSFEARDSYSLTASEARFADGSSYGIEVSSINNMQILQAAVAGAKKLDLKINRIDECRGLFRLPDLEVVEMVQFCSDENIKPVFSVGPRAVYDIGAFVKSKNGVRVGYRLRGMDNIKYALDDILRGIELGVKEFLVYDEGLLSIINESRIKKYLPADIKIKLSVHSGCANPVSARLFESLGADSINLVPDLDLPMLAAVRRATNCVLDIFTDTAADAGGFIRTPQVAEIIALCSPVFLKCGPVSQQLQNHLPTEQEITERMKQVRCVHESIERSGLNLKQLNEA